MEEYRGGEAVVVLCLFWGFVVPGCLLTSTVAPIHWASRAGWAFQTFLVRSRSAARE